MGLLKKLLNKWVTKIIIDGKLYSFFSKNKTIIYSHFYLETEFLQKALIIYKPCFMLKHIEMPTYPIWDLLDLFTIMVYV